MNTYQLEHLKNLQVSLPMQDGHEIIRSSPQKPPPLQDADAVPPKSLIRVPKDIIVYNLTQKLDRTVLDSFLNSNEIPEIDTKRDTFREFIKRSSLNKSTVVPLTRNITISKGDTTTFYDSST